MIQQRFRPGNGKMGLGFAIDNFKPQRRPAVNTIGEFLLVFGNSARFRRDQPKSADLAAAQLAGAHFQRLDSAVHGIIVKPPGPAQPFAQPDKTRESINDPKSAMGWMRDQQPAIVGAKIKRPIKVAIARTAPGTPRAAHGLAVPATGTRIATIRCRRTVAASIAVSRIRALRRVVPSARHHAQSTRRLTSVVTASGRCANARVPAPAFVSCVTAEFSSLTATVKGPLERSAGVSARPGTTLALYAEDSRKAFQAVKNWRKTDQSTGKERNK